MRIARAIAFVSLLAGSISHGQGGAGFGGGGMGNPRSRDDVVTRDHILTPGDRGEWPITAKAGEVIVARASSSVFDPAIEVVDKEGKLLAQNDDVEVGRQEARVLYRFPKEGDYRIWIKGYKSAAGGQYQFSLRRFTPLDAEPGRRLAASTETKGFQWIAVPAKKGQTIALTVRSSSENPTANVLAPDGEDAVVHTDDISPRIVRTVWRAEYDGAHFVRVANERSDNGAFAATFTYGSETPARVDDGPKGRQLAADGIDLWTFEVKQGDLIQVHAVAPDSTLYVRLQTVQAAPEGEASQFKLLEQSHKDPNKRYAVVLEDARLEASVYHPSGSSATYQFGVRRVAKNLTRDSQVASNLPVGGTEFWQFEAKKGEIILLNTHTEQFDSFIQLLDSKGEVLAGNDDSGVGRNSAFTMVIPEDGRYYVRVIAGGYGGGGAYATRLRAAEPKSLRIGESLEGGLGEGGTEIWSFDGKAGASLVFSARSADFDTSIKIVGPDGLEIAKSDDDGDGTDSLASVRLPLDGKYTVWVFSNRGSGKYKLRVIDLDR